jgi:hypothetical protein
MDLKTTGGEQSSAEYWDDPLPKILALPARTDRASENQTRLLTFGLR